MLQSIIPDSCLLVSSTNISVFFLSAEFKCHRVYIKCVQEVARIFKRQGGSDTLSK